MFAVLSCTLAIFICLPLLPAAVPICMLIDSKRPQPLSEPVERTVGLVRAAHAEAPGSAGNTPFHSILRETIEFRTVSGRLIRGVPRSSDVGMLDRTGLEVVVYYEATQPETFLAPLHGEKPTAPTSPSAMRMLVTIGLPVVAGVLLLAAVGGALLGMMVDSVLGA